MHPGKKYDVRILLGSIDVAGQWFTQQMPRVSSGDAGDAHPPVAQLELLCTNTTAILASWAPVEPSGAVVGYKLTYRMQGEEHQFRLVFDLQDRSYLAMNLL